MRIAFVTDNYRPYVGGVITYIELARRYLEQQGHETWLFAFGDPEVPQADPRIILMPGVQVPNTDGFYLGPRLTRRVRHLLGAMDLVHIDDPFVSGRLALNVCKAYRVPVVYTNHSRADLYPRYFAPQVPHRPVDDALRRYLRRFCRHVDAVVSPSASVAGIDLEPFFSARERAGEARPAGATFVFSGRLSVEKNLGVLASAFGRVAQRLPDARLLLIGDGPERAEMEASLAEQGVLPRVEFAGMVGHERMPELLLGADVWVSASVTEVLPMTAIEAMAVGLPIVGPDAPGIVDLVAPGVSGLLAEKNDAGDLARQMLALAGDEDLRRNMAAEAKRMARRYSIDRTGAELLALYEEVVADSRRIRPRGRRSPIRARIVRRRS
jgi:glycosyltransferase involved in cell wall biosynthesis